MNRRYHAATAAVNSCEKCEQLRRQYSVSYTKWRSHLNQEHGICRACSAPADPETSLCARHHVLNAERVKRSRLKHRHTRKRRASGG